MLYLNAEAFDEIKSLENDRPFICELEADLIRAEVAENGDEISSIKFSRLVAEDDYFIAEFDITWDSGLEITEPIRVDENGIVY